MQQDEIYLIDLWRILVREWKWFALVLVLLLAGTFAAAHLLKRQWQATAWIRIGQIGQVPAGRDPSVEPLARILEHLTVVPFQNQILASAGIAPDSPAARLYRKSLKLEPMPYAGPLIRLSVRAYSPQQADQLASATVAELRSVQQRLGAVPLKLARARLDEVRAELRNTVADRDRLLQAVAPGDRGAADGKGDRDSLLVRVLVSGKDDQIRQLRQVESDLVERLSPAYTYATSLAWPVYVPRNQAFPNPILVWGIGIMLGIFLGAFAAVARNAARRFAQGESLLPAAVRTPPEPGGRIATARVSTDDIQP